MRVQLPPSARNKKGSFMFLRFFCKFLILLLISGIFPSRKKLSCEEVDSLINLKYKTKDYESALVIATSNKNNENCSSDYYFNLGKIFLSFNDFSNTRELYNNSLAIAEGEEYNFINLEYSKLRFLQSEISFIQQMLNNKSVIAFLNVLNMLKL